MKKFLLLAGILCAFALGYGAMGVAYPAAGMYGRDKWHGYFTNVNDDRGTYVLPQDYGGEAIRPSVEGDVEDFISFMEYTKLDIDGNGSGNGQEKTGAAFIIQTMIGTSRSRPPTGSQLDTWERYVRAAAAEGRISWRVNYSFCINSYYQGPKGGGAPNDDAWYDECDTQPVILFRDPDGSIAYAIKWFCANPVGNVRPLSPPSNWQLTGSSSVSAGTQYPGRAVTFTHRIRNTGDATATGWRRAIFMVPPTPGISSETIRVGWANGPALAPDATTTITNSFTIPAGATAGQQYCQVVGYDPVNNKTPATRNGRSGRSCVTVIAPPTFSCNALTTTVSPAEVGVGMNVQFGISQTGGTMPPGPYTMTYSIGPTPAAAGSVSSGSMPITASVPYTPSARGTYTVNWSFAISGFSRTCTATFVAYTKPYMKVFNGDMQAGAVFAPSGATVCTTAASSGQIKAFNKSESPSSPANYSGSGASVAVMALQSIQGFVSAANASGATPPTGLTFANTSGGYGGNFGDSGCVPDYWSLAISPLGGPRILTPGDIPGSNGSSNNFTGKLDIFVNGDVHLRTDIRYNAAGWTRTTTPSFRLIVRGNIYIDSSVTQLDGLYVALGGTIYTCANGIGSPTAVFVQSGCNSQLRINGSFIANEVKFLRIANSLKDATTPETAATSRAAEIFTYSPDVWFAVPQNTGGDDSTYDAITSMPPIL